MAKPPTVAIAVGFLTAAVVAAVLCGVLLPEDPPPPSRKYAASIAGSEIEIMRYSNVTLLRGELGVTLDKEIMPCATSDENVIECQEWESEARLEVSEEGGDDVTCHHFKWSATSTDTVLQDCYDIDDAYWYGTGAIFNQHWPLNEWDQPMRIYASANIYRDPTWYGSLVERYWVSSSGVAIRVSHNTPLYVSINHRQNGKICFRGAYPSDEDTYTSYKNPDSSAPILDYRVCTSENVRRIHEYMTNRFVKKPTGLPDVRMMRSPIWSTWARYKKFINQSIILDFAHEILDNGFNNSQLEIDDGYSYRNFGDFIFDEVKFPDPAGMIRDLHDLGFRVTLWITPFANQNTDAWIEGDGRGYWVQNADETTAEVLWWNGPRAGMLDATNPEAVDWFVSRLKQAQAEFGIDSFKFDAGETQYLGNHRTYKLLKNPCEYTTKWVQLAEHLGSQIEVRSSFENQRQPTFLRMMDKDSKWGWDNGLKTLITTALTYSVLGYSYVLPDMIGGNGYPFFGIFPDKELYIRWLQITAFLPAMQYSISPWQFPDPAVTDIARNWTNFHESVITPMLVRLAEEELIPHGKPLIRPLWWIAPDDPETFTVDSQFLVGDDLLVAPILEDRGRSRDVYLPAGQWVDETHGVTVDGGKWLESVSCELHEVLYYTRQGV
ncbi:myogenesis-regulating glycosidase-like [Diadema antillarum]|uniref:myogenesis-regulating glycosidase-like n=1 Tax=Diadema antillarum TaxID=105358 RepID=UPI003A878B11